jgi:histidine decarboxylase
VTFEPSSSNATASGAAEGDPADMETLERRLADLAASSLGMPLNQDKPDLSALGLSGLARFTLDNMGDPFDESGSYLLHTKAYEREVIGWFAGLYRAEDDHWGYMTTGGSEGNLFGLYLGRERLRREAVASGSAPLLLSSADAHYSLTKSGRLLDLEHRVVAALPHGELDYDELAEAVAANRARPLLLALSAGTTLKGGMDDVERVTDLIEAYEVEHFHIHCDAALSGMVLPFVDGPLPVHFGLPIGSMSISGHKFLGCPLPCGIVLTRQSYLSVLSQKVEVIGSRDLTITGSRSGFATLLFWYLLQRKRAGLRREVRTCLGHAAYLHERLRERGWPVLHDPRSATVALRSPASRAVAVKFQLTVQGEWSRVVVLPHVRRDMLDRFLAALDTTHPVP